MASDDEMLGMLVEMFPHENPDHLMSVLLSHEKDLGESISYLLLHSAVDSPAAPSDPKHGNKNNQQQQQQQSKNQAKKNQKEDKEVAALLYQQQQQQKQLADEKKKNNNNIFSPPLPEPMEMKIPTIPWRDVREEEETKAAIAAVAAAVRAEGGGNDDGNGNSDENMEGGGGGGGAKKRQPTKDNSNTSNNNSSSDLPQKGKENENFVVIVTAAVLSEENQQVLLAMQNPIHNPPCDAETMHLVLWHRDDGEIDAASLPFGQQVKVRVYASASDHRAQTVSGRCQISDNCVMSGYIPISMTEPLGHVELSLLSDCHSGPIETFEIPAILGAYIVEVERVNVDRSEKLGEEEEEEDEQQQEQVIVKGGKMYTDGKEIQEILGLNSGSSSNSSSNKRNNAHAASARRRMKGRGQAETEESDYYSYDDDDSRSAASSEASWNSNNNNFDDENNPKDMDIDNDEEEVVVDAETGEWIPVERKRRKENSMKRNDHIGAGASSDSVEAAKNNNAMMKEDEEWAAAIAAAEQAEKDERDRARANARKMEESQKLTTKPAKPASSSSSGALPMFDDALFSAMIASTGPAAPVAPDASQRKIILPSYSNEALPPPCSSTSPRSNASRHLPPSSSSSSSFPPLESTSPRSMDDRSRKSSKRKNNGDREGKLQFIQGLLPHIDRSVLNQILTSCDDRVENLVEFFFSAEAGRRGCEADESFFFFDDEEDESGLSGKKGKASKRGKRAWKSLPIGPARMDSLLATKSWKGVSDSLTEQRQAEIKAAALRRDQFLAQAKSDTAAPMPLPQPVRPSSPSQFYRNKNSDDVDDDGSHRSKIRASPSWTVVSHKRGRTERLAYAPPSPTPQSREELESEINYHREMRFILFQSAAAAFAAGDRAAAYRFSQRGREESDKFRDANQKLLDRFPDMRRDEGIFVDLHGFLVEEGLEHLKDLIAKCKRRATRDCPQIATVLTGVGKHSANGYSKLREMTRNYLADKGIRHLETRPGLFHVEITDDS